MMMIKAKSQPGKGCADWLNGVTLSVRRDSVERYRLSVYLFLLSTF